MASGFESGFTSAGSTCSSGLNPFAVMEHPTGININFILNASKDTSDTNLLMDVPEKQMATFLSSTNQQLNANETAIPGDSIGQPLLAVEWDV